MMAVLRSKAWMPRKSSFSAPGGGGAGLPEGAAVEGAEDGAVGSAGPGDAFADGVDAAEAGGGVGVLEVELGVGRSGRGQQEEKGACSMREAGVVLHGGLPPSRQKMSKSSNEKL